MNSRSENAIRAVLDEMIQHNEGYLNVPPIDGKMLRLLTEAAGAKNVVEIGTSTGYSGLWFSLALLATGGKLTTFEMDADRASAALQHFEEKAGVDGIITIVQGDAHSNVRHLEGPVDLLFLDADKEGYIDYLNTLLPLVRPSGLILAHNVDMVPEYIELVNRSRDLETLLYMDGGGLAISLKKH